MQRSQTITVKDTEISLLPRENDYYISITDIIKAKDGDFFISDWLRNRNTVEFLGVWERINNPNFNYGEYATIKSQAGLNSYKISVKEWVTKTNAIGLKSTAGRYGGTYAHPDIAYEFGMWISPEFKIYLIKEFSRLKSEEQQRLSSEWNLQRTLAKINYHIHTDAIKERLIPNHVSTKQKAMVYADEAELLNVALFGKTAAEFRKDNPSSRGNIRDEATLEQLVVLSNLESINALLIRDGLAQSERLEKLNLIAIEQLKSLLSHNAMGKLKTGSDKAIKP